MDHYNIISVKKLKEGTWTDKWEFLVVQFATFKNDLIFLIFCLWKVLQIYFEAVWNMASQVNVKRRSEPVSAL